MLYNNKKSCDWYCRKFMDTKRNEGFDYHGQILKNVLSPEMFSNPAQDISMRQIERVIEHLIDTVKSIKSQFFISKDKDDKDFN